MIPETVRGFLQNIKVEHPGPQGTLEDILGEICIGYELDDNVLHLVFTNGAVLKMHHHQSCCEAVWIEDINGDLNDLLLTPLNVFEERTQADPKAEESATWTFYTLRTIKGSIDIRWYGTSNGYYSETADVDVWLPKYGMGSAHARTSLLESVTQELKEFLNS